MQAASNTRFGEAYSVGQHHQTRQLSQNEEHSLCFRVQAHF